MPETKPNFFITGATGSIGGAAAHGLLAEGYGVRALVRNSKKPAAQDLQSKGAELIEGDYDNTSALLEGMRGCTGVFINTFPVPDEPTHAANIISAARQSGIETLVCSTVARAGEHDSFQGWNPDGLMSAYWIRKAAIQEKVKEAGFKRWTIVQPAWLMTNLLTPVSTYYWPELASQKALVASVRKDTKFDMTDPQDVGAFAVRALVDPSDSLYQGNMIKVASESLTLDEIAQTMSTVSGANITTEFRSDEENEQMKDMNPFAATQIWQRDEGTKVNLDDVRSYGVALTTFGEFLQRNADKVAASVGK